MSILYRRCYFSNTFYVKIQGVMPNIIHLSLYICSKEHTYDSIFTIRELIN